MKEKSRKVLQKASLFSNASYLSIKYSTKGLKRVKSIRLPFLMLLNNFHNFSCKMNSELTKLRMDYKCEAFNEGEILRILHKLSGIFANIYPLFKLFSCLLNKKLTEK